MEPQGRVKNRELIEAIGEILDPDAKRYYTLNLRCECVNTDCPFPVVLTLAEYGRVSREHYIWSRRHHLAANGRAIISRSDIYLIDQAYQKTQK